MLRRLLLRLQPQARDGVFCAELLWSGEERGGRDVRGQGVVGAVRVDSRDEAVAARLHREAGYVGDYQ